MFKLEIDTSNDAFQDEDKVNQIVFILKDVIHHLQHGRATMLLRDSNGNKCGKFSLTRN